MTLLGVTGILLGLAAWPWAFLDRTRLKIAVFAGAYLMQIGCGIAYFFYVQHNSADTQLYYFDEINARAEGFGTGSQFIIWMVQVMRGAFGGAYLDYFFVFQAIGFFGIALLMRIIEEVFAELDVRERPWIYILLFLPGLHFWTSAIGKDAPLFSACCLSVWSAMHIRRRYVGFGVAVVLMLLIRPHIAFIAVAAGAWAVFGDRNTRPAVRIFFTLVSIAGMAIAAATMKSTFRLDLTNADSVSDFLAVQDNFLTTEDVGNSAVLNASYPVRVFSLLFRPLFIDADDAFGLIASLENTVIFLVVLALMFHARTVFRLIKGVLFARYALIFSVGVTAILAFDYFNIGLGLRQKTMLVPGFLIVFIAMVASRQARRSEPVGVEDSAQSPALA